MENETSMLSRTNIGTIFFNLVLINFNYITSGEKKGTFPLTIVKLSFMEILILRFKRFLRQQNLY